MIDIFFPRLCSSCDVPIKSFFLCDDCRSRIVYLSEFNVCGKCGDPLERAVGKIPEGDRKLCGKCLSGEFKFEKARSIVLFEGILRDMLHLFKYRGKISIGKKLVGFLRSFLPGDFDEFDIIVPVPVHNKKLKQREFNQD